MRVSFVPTLMLFLPLAEIAGFVIVGKAVGIGITLLLVLLGTIVGLGLLRSQGASMVKSMSNASGATGKPEDIAQGAMTIVAGILLLVPGFITDIAALLLLVPFVRKLIWNRMSGRIVTFASRSPFGQPFRDQTSNPRQPNNGAGQVVDLDEQDFHREPNGNSPWANKNRLRD